MRKLFIVTSILCAAFVLACFIYSEWKVSRLTALDEPIAAFGEPVERYYSPVDAVPQYDADAATTEGLPPARFSDTRRAPTPAQPSHFVAANNSAYMELFESGQIDLDTAIDMAKAYADELAAEAARYSNSLPDPVSVPHSIDYLKLYEAGEIDAATAIERLEAQIAEKEERIADY